MSDEVDFANDIVEQTIQNAINASGAFKSGIKYTGSCFNCGEALAMPKRWCGADCRDEYESKSSSTHRKLG